MEGDAGMEFLYVIAIAAAAVLAVVVWYISTMNAFARLTVKITESDSGIDVALTKGKACRGQSAEHVAGFITTNRRAKT